jgi:hypothetical protein
MRSIVLHVSSGARKARIRVCCLTVAMFDKNTEMKVRRQEEITS